MAKETHLFAPSERLLEIAEEFLDRVRKGESPCVEEYSARYAENSSEINRYLPMLLPASTQSTRTDDERDIPVHPESMPTGINRYLLERLLGRGSMGAVYLARDLELDRTVAFKIPRIRHIQSAERFYREARAMATVTHPNICPVYDVGEIEAEDIDDPSLLSAVGRPFMTMAYIDGDDLSELLTTPWEPRVAVEMIRKVASALQVAHEAGVVHRDIKPGNIIVDRNFEPAITDFGLAMRNLPDEVELTLDGQIIGSPAYMSPEQINADPALGPRADIYSLGIVLYEMVSGQRPFSGSPLTLLRDICWKEPPSPRQFRTELDAGIESICLKAIAKEPDDRYQTASELVADLDAWLAGDRVASSPAPRNRVLVFLAPIIATGFIVFGVQSIWPTNSTTPPDALPESSPDGSTATTPPPPTSTRDDVAAQTLRNRLNAVFQRQFRERTGTTKLPDISSEYAAIFAEKGITPESSSVRSVGDFLDAQSAASRHELLIGLEAWLVCITRETEDVPAPWLRAILEAEHAEHSPLRKTLLDVDDVRLAVLPRQYQARHSDPRLAIIWSLYLNQIDKTAAADFLMSAYNVYPDDPWINMAVGLQHHRDGDPEKALPNLQLVDEQLPSAHTSTLLAQCLLKTHQPAKAADAARKAIELAPEYANAHLVLGHALFRLDLLQEAEGSLAKSLDMDCARRAVALALRARCVARLGAKSDAMPYAEEAIAIFREENSLPRIVQFMKNMLHDVEAESEHSFVHHRFVLIRELYRAAEELEQIYLARPYVDRALRDLVSMEETETHRIRRLRKMLSTIDKSRKPNPGRPHGGS